jgi:hypothetical protein
MALLGALPRLVPGIGQSRDGVPVGQHGIAWRISKLARCQLSSLNPLLIPRSMRIIGANCSVVYGDETHVSQLELLAFEFQSALEIIEAHAFSSWTAL